MLKKTALNSINSCSMVSGKDKVLAAVSGGPDSMAMLKFLSGFPGIRLTAIHLNHRIRGREADKDSLLVKEYCKALGIPLVIRSFDVPLYAKKRKLSLEEAGRQARYKIFDQEAGRIRANKIAVAHNADDNVETFIMRLMRGTGLKGLCGIPPVRGRIIRPLIDVWKKDVLEYCSRNKVPFRVDKSNLSTKFTRNKIRHLIIPVLEKEDPRLKSKVVRCIKSFSKDYALLNKRVEELGRKLLKRTGKGISIDRKKLFSLREGLKGFLVREAIEKLHGNLVNIDEVHISNVLSLTRGYIHLPNGIYAAVDDRHIVLTKTKPKKEKAGNFSFKLSIPGNVRLPEGGACISARCAKPPKKIKAVSRSETFIDAGKIKWPLSVRNIRKGDRFIPLGMKGGKKLQDFFVDLKVPVQERSRVPIVCDREKILWVAGYRMDDRVKIDAASKKVVRLSYIR